MAEDQQALSAPLFPITQLAYFAPREFDQMALAQEELPVQSETLSSAVERFCTTRRLLSWLLIALQMVRESFPQSSPTVRVVKDPDSEDEWITIDVVATGEVSQVIDAERRFMRRLLERLPESESDKIRLAYDII